MENSVKQNSESSEEKLDFKKVLPIFIIVLIDLLGLWAAERPLVLVLEDAQWLDALSWQLALQVARSLAELPILVKRGSWKRSVGAGSPGA